MPKERRNRSKSRASPFPCSSSSYQKHSSSSTSRNQPESSVPAAKDIKEWEEVRCPVCMEHPHNAVLLLCTSHDKGCRPFMCDTSYRHSNCLDQYRKTSAGSSSGQENHICQQTSELSCPLCRGGITGWSVVEPARKHMNTMARSCALESCAFVGEYKELRKHARSEHPTVRPSETDPERERDWRRMEQRRDMLDLFSSMRSTIGGEESGAEFFEEDEDMGGMLRFPPFMLIFVLRLNLPGTTSSRFDRIPRGPSRGSLRGRAGRRAGALWGETNSEPESTTTVLDDGEDDDNGAEAESEEAPSVTQQNQGRPRRQLRMSEDEDEDEDEDDEDDDGNL